MSEEKSSPVDQMKDWARRAPPPNGPIPDSEDLGTHLKAERMVVVLMDSNGRAYHISNVNLQGAQLTLLEQPRTALNELMDAYGVADGPAWSEVRD